MTVKDLKKRLSELDEDKVVLVSDGKGWTNIEHLHEGIASVSLVMETESLFDS